MTDKSKAQRIKKAKTRSMEPDQPETMSSMKKGAVAADVKIPEEEWNFSLCPEDELEECKVYECCRRSSLWRAVFEVLQKYPRTDNWRCATEGWDRIFGLLCVFPEFPVTPWLGILPAKRKARLRILAKRLANPGLACAMPSILEGQIPDESQQSPSSGALIVPTLDRQERPALRQLEDWELDDEYRDLFDEPEYVEGPFWDAAKKEGEILRRYRPADPVEKDVVASFRICLDYPDEKIVEGFRGWLSATRTRAGVSSIARKGKYPTRPDMLLADLTALAAKQLLEATGWSYAGLIEYTKKRRRHEGGSDWPLYLNSKDWKKAAARVESIVQSATPPSLYVWKEGKTLRSEIKAPKGVQIEIGKDFDQQWVHLHFKSVGDAYVR